jgi:hypothetical protein
LSTRSPCWQDWVRRPVGTHQHQRFEFGCEQLFAILHDQSGKNFPQNICLGGWLLKLRFTLGAREAMPVAIAPEPVLRGLRSIGYYIWREGYGPAA